MSYGEDTNMQPLAHDSLDATFIAGTSLRRNRLAGLGLAAACVGSALVGSRAMAQDGTIVQTPLVAGGSGFVVQTPGTNSWTFTATGPQLIVQCAGFGVPSGNTISHVRSGGGAFSTLDRVSGTARSFINGQITAGSGSVWIVNPNGIDVHAVAESTAGSMNLAAGTVVNADFLAGTRRFVGRTAVNHGGRITAAGPVAIVGANVTNSGPISLSAAQSVSVVAARGSVTLPLAPSDPQAFFTLAYDPSIPLTDPATGLLNSGNITVAPGGAIRLGASDGYATAIRNTGTLQAVNGEIRFTAPGERVEQSGDALRSAILGVDAGVRNGFDAVRVHFEIDADATEAQIAALVAQSQKRSAVFDILTNPTDVMVTAKKA